MVCSSTLAGDKDINKKQNEEFQRKSSTSMY